MSRDASRPRYCLVGTAVLTMRCAEAVLERGDGVACVVSSSPEVRAWAQEHGIAALPDFAALDRDSEEARFDHLVSVVNGTVLPPEVLALPRKLAVNFHDAPLPRYAGVHATSWALLDGATSHGVTWHLMAEDVDAGGILKQAAFPVGPDDTAYQVNLACHELALTLFRELLGDLGDGGDGPVPRPQDATRRTYFGRDRRAPGGGLLTWTADARELARTVRAHHFGPVVNTFGTAKAWFGGDTSWTVEEIEVLAGRSGRPAGTLLAVGERPDAALPAGASEATGSTGSTGSAGSARPAGCADIATAGQDIRLHTLTAHSGTRHAAADVLASAGLAPGDVLPAPDEALRARLAAALTEAAPHEAYCVRQLGRAVAAYPPVAARYGASPGAPAGVPVPLPADIAGTAARRHGTGAHAARDVVLTALLLHLGQGSTRTPVSVALSSTATRRRVAGLEAFLTDGVPFTLVPGPDDTVGDVVGEVGRRTPGALRRGVRPHDLPGRHLLTPPPRPLPVEVLLTDGEPVTPRLLAGPRPLTVVWDASAGTLRLHSSGVGGDPVYDDAALREIADGLGAAVAVCLDPGAPAAVAARPAGAGLRRWERGPRIARNPVDLWGALADRLRTGGDRTAVVCADRALSYRELDARTAALARALRAAGTTAETPVAVSVPASAELLVACLAVFRAGGVYVPLDPEWPPERTAAILDDVRPVAVLAAAGTDIRWDGPLLILKDGAGSDGPDGAGRPDGLDGSEVTGSRDPAGGGRAEPWPFEGAEGQREAGAATADRAACVFYTSGSAGPAKGVVVTHRGLVNRMTWWQENHPLHPDDVLLQCASPGFDISLWELLAAPLAGARLVVAEHREHGIVPYLPRLLRAQGVTVAHFVPSVLGELTRACGPGERLPLRLAVCGGETVSPTLRDAFLACCPGTLVHAYGPTEATITVLHDVCDTAAAVRDTGADPDKGGGPGRGPERGVPLGRPLSNTTVALLGPDGRRVPVGSPGEIALGGDPLARGYHGAPGRTASRFGPVPDSDGEDGRDGGHGGDVGERLYRTGDRARYLPDGRLEFLGRADEEFKIHGHRVDPAEIEGLLHRHPAVRRASVQLLDDRAGRPAVVAFVAAGERAADESWAGALRGDLRAYLAVRLPRPVVPTRWVVRETFPLGSAGKTDREALRTEALRTGALRAETSRAAAVHPADTDTSGTGDGGGGGDRRTGNGALERALCTLWEELLDVDRVSPEDDFFALGGHSLVATRTLTAVWRDHGVLLRLADVMEGRTVAELARRIEAMRAAAPAAGTEPVTQPGSGGTLSGADAPDTAESTTTPEWLPLSNAQQRVLFEEEFLGAGAFNVPVATRWRGPLDAEVLRDALAELTHRHAMLRGAVEHDTARLRIVPAGEVPLPFAVEDLTAPGPDTVPSPGPDTVPSADASGSHGLPGEERLAARLAELLADPFDLASAPLLRARLLRLSPHDHVFVLVLHHIVCDRWSVEVLFRELRELYTAALEGRAAVLPDTGAAHLGHAAAVRRQEERAGAEIEHWRRRLDGAEFDIELLVGGHRPAEPAHRAGLVAWQLAPERAAALRAVCVARGVTPFVFLLAAFQVLLHRFSTADNLVVGAPVADRDLSESDGVVGMLVNTVPLRADLRGNPRFAELLTETRGRVLEAYEHHAVPVERLAAALGQRRSAGHHPLVQFMLAWEESAGVEAALPGCTAEPVRPPAPVTAYDLTLVARELPDGLALELEFSRDLFDEAAAGVLAEAFGTLLDAFTADGGSARIGDVPLATPHVPPRSYALPAPEAAESGVLLPVTEMIAEAVRRNPHGVALVDGDTEVGYAQLQRRADRVAARLRAEGCGAGDTVAVCLPRSAALFAVLLGVLRAGAAYLPLDAAEPDERVRRQLEISGTRLTVTAAAHAERFAVPGAAVLVVDADGCPAQGPAAGDPVPEHDRSSPNPGPAPAAHDPAYTIFTSGSTGEPKGVVVEHGALADHVRWACAAFALTPRDRVLQFASPTFDVMAEEVFPTLCAGATLVLRSAEAALSPQECLAQCARTGVTVVNLPTGYWTELTGVLAEESARLPEEIRLCVIGGEQAGAATVARWRARTADRHALRLVNAYGPTEATIGVTAAELGPAARPVLPAAIPVGAPTSRTRIHLLDRYGHPVPDGTTGEVHLAGPGLARGYAHRPALTAARFVPDPYSPVPGGRMFRTGDLARRVDGELYFLGRADRQVKVRGFRIEPDEVERVLAAHPAVDEAAVLVPSDGPGALDGADGTDASAASRLVAYVAARDGVTAAELRAHLTARLPAFMTPSAFVVRDRLPRTPAGKTDHRALAAESPPGTEETGVRDGAAVSAADNVPRTGRERRLCALWAATLRTAEVGPHSDFFDLGGNSLLAMELVRHMRRDVLPEVTVRTLFDAPTVAGLLARFPGTEAPGEEATAGTAGTAGTDAADGAGQVDGTVPLTAAQLAIWLRTEAEPGLPFHTPVLLRLRGALDRAALERAMQRLLERHDALRGVLDASGEAPVFRLLPPDALPRPTAADHSGDGLTDRPGALAELLRGIVDRPFDLLREPPVRAVLVRLADDDHVCALVLHHIAADGWSARLLQRELAALYTAETSAPGAAVPLPAPGSFRALATASAARQPDEDGLRFWREHLEGAPARLELPTGPHRPGAEPGRGPGPGRHTCRIPVPSATAEALRRLGRARQATLFMVLLSAVHVWLARCCRQDDIVTGTPVADRDTPSRASVVGPLVDVLPVRTPVPGDATFAEQVDRTRAAVLDVFQHKDVPAQRILEQYAAGERARQRTLVRAVFDLEDEDVLPTPPFGRGLTAEALNPAPSVGVFDLELTARADGDGDGDGDDAGRDGGLVLELRGARGLFEPGAVEHLAASLAHVLDHVARRPDTRVAELPLTGPAERRRLTAALDRTGWTDHTDRTGRAGRTADPEPGVLALFAGHTAAHPDAVAVTGGGRSLTYRQTAGLAERVAHWLRTVAHAGPESSVAVRTGRCAELPAVVLGIWQAGCAYVPLDPRNPAARTRAMLADCAPAALITGGPAGPGPVSGAADGSGTPGVPVLDLSALTTLPVPSTSASASVPASSDPADRLAYLTYTSGSTGEPRGVLCTHGGFANQLRWSRRGYPLRPGESLLQVAATGFDISLWEMFHPLTCGARLVVLDDAAHGDVSAVADAVVREDITALHLVPTLLEGFVEETGAMTAPGLRTVLCGGERVPAGLPERFTSRSTGARLHHTYGPTEASIIVTHWAVPQELAASGPGEGAAPPLGGPVDGVRLYLLDAGGEPVPVGVTGELVVAGDVLARGYLGRPGATAASFVPDPHSARPGARMYRTGDLARLRTDGTLEFVGRADRQLKIGGVRVEPREVETALAAHPGVAACAVLPRETGGRTVLVGYVVPGGPAAPGTAELTAHLGERLPQAMVPRSFVPLPALPVTANGKLDTAALPAPDASDAAPSDGTGGTDGAEPRTDTERRLAAVWGQVLPVARAVGPHDNFFDLGGDSVTAIRVVARARAAGLRLSIAQVLRTSTLADAAAAAVPAEATDPTDPTTDVRDGVGGTDGLWPTPAQHAFLTRAGEYETPAGPAHFNQAVLLAPRTAPDPATLRAALRAVAAHHDAFRLRLAGARDEDEATGGATGEDAAHGGPRLSLLPPGTPGERLASLTVAPAGTTVHPEERPEEWAELLRPVHEGLDPRTGPLLAGLLARRDDGTPVLLLAAHHLAVDTASWETVLAGLETAYHRIAEGLPAALPPSEVPFGDLARSLPALARRAETVRQRAYWREQLDAVRPLPEDAPDTPDTPDTPDGGTAPPPLTAATGEETARALVTGTARHGMRADELLLTAVARAVARWTGDHSVTFLRETHGREPLPGRADVTGTVGWLSAVFPLAVTLPDDDPEPQARPADPGTGPDATRGLAASLRACRSALRAVPYGGTGYGLLRSADDPALRGSAEPEISVNYLGATTGPHRSAPGATEDTGLFPRAAHQSLGAYAAPRHRTGGPAIEVTAGLDERGLWTEWEWDTGRFARRTVEALMRDTHRTLTALAAVLDEGREATAVPGDFPDVTLTQEQLGALLTRCPGATDVLPLAPAQQGMLAWQLARQGGGAYHTQMLFEAEGALGEELLREGWAAAVAAHDVLRTAFVAGELDAPAQVVTAPDPRGAAALDWRRHELTGVTREAALERLERLLAEDRAEPFDLARPGALRWHWLDAGEAGRWLLWSHHHILLDGWSLPLVLGDVADACAARHAGRPWQRPPGPRYADYLRWLAGRDTEAGAEFWRAHLAPEPDTGTATGTGALAGSGTGRATGGGLAAPTAHGAPDATAHTVVAELSERHTADLAAIAERHRVTLHSLVLAAWAVLLRQRAAGDDVVLGVVMSLRPDEVPDAERVVGLCLNTLPLRLEVTDDAELPELFRHAQERLLAVYEHAAHPLGEIRRWAGLDGSTAPFDSVVVFENYPGDRTGQPVGDLGRLRVVRAVESTEFPVSLTVSPGDRMTFDLTSRADTLAPQAASALSRRLIRLLQHIAEALREEAA
ncbi:amino acid adenylation domain-containing protein [Streptomyces sp. NPDC054796]